MGPRMLLGILGWSAMRAISELTATPSMPS